LRLKAFNSGVSCCSPSLVQQIDGIDLEPLERCFRYLLDMLWPTVESAPLASARGIRFPSEPGWFSFCDPLTAESAPQPAAFLEDESDMESFSA
jgi:hypothetical protein